MAAAPLELFATPRWLERHGFNKAHWACAQAVLQRCSEETCRKNRSQTGEASEQAAQAAALANAPDVGPIRDPILFNDLRSFDPDQCVAMTLRGDPRRLQCFAPGNLARWWRAHKYARHPLNPQDMEGLPVECRAARAADDIEAASRSESRAASGPRAQETPLQHAQRTNSRAWALRAWEDVGDPNILARAAANAHDEQSRAVEARRLQDEAVDQHLMAWAQELETAAANRAAELQNEGNVGQTRPQLRGHGVPTSARLQANLAASSTTAAPTRETAAFRARLNRLGRRTAGPYQMQAAGIADARRRRSRSETSATDDELTFQQRKQPRWARELLRPSSRSASESEGGENAEWLGRQEHLYNREMEEEWHRHQERLRRNLQTAFAGPALL